MNLSQSSSPVFLRISQDEQSKLWCISPIAQLKSGYEFLITCTTKEVALDVVERIKLGFLNYPTVNSNGYSEVTSKYPLLNVKVFTVP